MNPKFIISPDKRIVTCIAKSKNQKFIGVAKCCNEDIPNIEHGMKLSRCRAEYNIRKKNLLETRNVKNQLKFFINTSLKDQSKLWMIYYQDACREEKEQLVKIKLLKKKIKKLSC